MTDTERQVDRLLDTAPCGFVSFTDDGAVRTVNETLLEMLGLSHAELLGEHIETVLSNGARIFYQTQFFPLLRLEGRADEVFLLLRAKDGSDVGALANAVRRERDGEWVTDCVFLRLRERRKFEDALLRAKKAADEARLAANEQRQRVEEVNTQLERQNIELEIGQQQLMEQAEELESQTEELRTLHEALADRSEELERLRAVADEANEAKAAFLSTIIRELQVPLDAVGPVAEGQVETLARISRSQRHLLHLINDTLSLARAEAGRVEYDLERFDLRSVSHAILRMVEPQLKARRLHYEMNIAPNLAVYADRKKVQQILLGLLSNAIRFTPADGRVTVDALSDPARNGHVYLRVMDTGVGIAADRRDHVFDPFAPQDDNRPGRLEGAGLGLAVGRDFARGMGGDLRVRSETGVGSSFTLTLPRADPQVRR